MMSEQPSLMPEPPESAQVDRDHLVVLPGVSWGQYASLRAALDDHPGIRMTYFEGVLEIMRPSRQHEHGKKLIARLVEAYAEERDVDLLGFGAETHQRKRKKLGLEPDESYCVGKEKKVPDIAIEVVITSGGIDKLAAYRRLGVPEVWFWVRGRLHVFHLGRKGYQRRTRSAFLPGLDLDEVSRIVAGSTRAEQTRAVRRFREALRKAR